MKVLKKPKFKKITCAVCDCVFVPASSDILADADGPWKEGRVFARCPVCLAACEATPRRRPRPGVSSLLAEPLCVIQSGDKKSEIRCGTCKYTNRTFEDDPCCDCGDGHSKWEAAE